MTELLVLVLIIVGTAFSVLAAIGLVRMPDIYSRLQVTTKSATIGASSLVFAAALRFGDTGTATRAFLIVAFMFLTAPIAAHMIGRAAYAAGDPLWEGTVLDEWADNRDSGKAPKNPTGLPENPPSINES